MVKYAVMSVFAAALALANCSAPVIFSGTGTVNLSISDPVGTGTAGHGAGIAATGGGRFVPSQTGTSVRVTVSAPSLQTPLVVAATQNKSGGYQATVSVPVDGPARVLVQALDSSGVPYASA